MKEKSRLREFLVFLKKQKRSYLVFGGLITVAIVGLVVSMVVSKQTFIKQFSENNLPDESVIIDGVEYPAHVVTVAGEEPITTKDVEELSQLAFDMSEDQVVTLLTQESFLLQAAEKEGLLVLPEGFRQAADGVFPRSERLKYLEQAKTAYEGKLAVMKGGALITVFFYNHELEDSGYDSLEEAEEDALSKIEEAYDWVVEEGLEPSVVIQRLADDPVVQQLDWNAAVNTGVTYGEQPIARIVGEPVYIRALKSLVQVSSGKWVSPVTRYPGPEEDYPASFFIERDENRSETEAYGNLDNGYYFFYVLNEKPEGYLEGFEDWRMSVINNPTSI